LRFRKIHIVGGPGSGKTFCANKLNLELGLVAHDLDTVFWDQSKNSYIRESEEIRDKKMAIILRNESWIVTRKVDEK
jgi:adenylate kinase family enzyme